MKEAIATCAILLAGLFLWVGYKWGQSEANYEHYIALEKYKRYKCKDGTVYQRTPSGYWEDVKKSCRNEEQM